MNKILKILGFFLLLFTLNDVFAFIPSFDNGYIDAESSVLSDPLVKRFVLSDPTVKKAIMKKAYKQLGIEKQEKSSKFQSLKKTALKLKATASGPTLRAGAGVAFGFFTYLAYLLHKYPCLNLIMLAAGSCDCPSVDQPILTMEEVHSFSVLELLKVASKLLPNKAKLEMIGIDPIYGML